MDVAICPHGISPALLESFFFFCKNLLHSLFPAPSRRRAVINYFPSGGGIYVAARLSLDFGFGPGVSIVPH